jgi:cation transporter-like permease
MGTDRIQRLFPLSGVLFAAVLAVGLWLTAGEPDNSSSQAKIYTYWHGHNGVQLLSSLVLIPFGVLFLLVFAAELRRALRSGEAGEATYSPIALAGGILAAAGLGVTGSLGAAVATAAHHGNQSATYTLAQLQSYDWVPWMIGFAILLLASGVGGLRTKAFPKPVSISAVVLGVLCITPIGFFALFLVPVWTFCTSLVLFRGQRPSRSRVRESAIQSA